MDDFAPPQPIVVGYDASPQARDAVALGVSLARATGAPITLAGAYGPPARLSQDELDTRARKVGERLEAAEAELLADSPVPVERRAVPGPSAAAALQQLAEELQPSGVVLGSSHHGPLGRVLIGSVAERLLDGAPCPVVVAPRGFADREPTGLRTVCVGFDGRAEGWTALQRAAQIAAEAGAHLRMVMALPELTGPPTAPLFPAETAAEHHRRAQIELDRARKSVAERLEAEALLLRGHPQVVLAEQAAKDVDLLVTGSRGYGPLRRVLLGSVSTSLMRSAACPVMVVPRTAELQPTAEGMAAEDELTPAER